VIEGETKLEKDGARRWKLTVNPQKVIDFNNIWETILDLQNYKKNEGETLSMCKNAAWA